MFAGRVRACATNNVNALGCISLGSIDMILPRSLLPCLQEQYREAAALYKLEQDAARRAAQRAARQREEEALAALHAAQQRKPVAFELVSEAELDEEALAMVLPALEGMAVEELRAACAGAVGVGEAAVTAASC